MYNIALAGNPNTGKSTIFNALTKMNQHTGNWPGKTVDKSEGKYTYNNIEYNVVDLPGTYSLITKSDEEVVARDYICSGKSDLTVVVIDATSVQRNLNLVFQIMEMQENIILVINLIDEAKKKGISIDSGMLSNILQVPVVITNARIKLGINDLQKTIHNTIKEPPKSKAPFKIDYKPEIESKIAEKSEKLSNIKNNHFRRWVALKLILGEQSAIDKLNNIGYKIKEKADKEQENVIESVVTSIMAKSRIISFEVISIKKIFGGADRKIDKFLTSKTFGIPIMILLLSLILFLTISGANIPSSMLANFFDNIEILLVNIFNSLNVPEKITSFAIFGFYRTLGWVIAVMLPPMAIFFPMFAILEDYGYLPRVAFNLDSFFKRVGSTGKQSLTMMMAFGCNAAAIASSRIIASPKERIVAIVTNNFMPCNGRFPTIILVSTLFLGSLFGAAKTLTATLVLTIAIVFQFFITAIVSSILTSTSLKHIPSTLTLELPPYRRPQFLRLIVRATLDKTVKILIRAIKVAAPAGIIIWILSNTFVNDYSLFHYCVEFLNPFAHMMGLDGTILMGFILGLPANEIVMPIIIMGYMHEGALLELSSMEAIGDLFIGNGWTVITAINVIILSLNHYPCGTTLYSIQKETNSIKWTFASFIIPTIIGIILTTIVAQVSNLII